MRDQVGQRQFLAELQTWMDLPEYPHLTACRFFRTLDDEVVVFAEHVEGGSLAKRIRSRELTKLPEMLDMAIQCAWGLHAIHECGVIHQDFKPGNVLLTLPVVGPTRGMPWWAVAKVTDFGLARARKVAGEAGSGPGQSILVSAGGMTEAYCSPEQARGEPLSRRTDIWSWGVAVLEMFIGEVSWRSGTDAPEVLGNYLASGGVSLGLPAMPAALVDVLRRCFQHNPAGRWPNLALAAESLQRIYRQVWGEDHPRPVPAAPDRRHRQTVVHDPPGLYGVFWTEPREWLLRLMHAEGRDPTGVEALLPARHWTRGAQMVADLAALEEARWRYENLVTGGRKDLEADLAALCIQKAKVEVDPVV